MFVRAFTLVLAIAASVIAAPTGDTTTNNQCNTANMYCCNSGTSPESLANSLTAGLLGLGSVLGSVNLGCDPITAIGTGAGATCQQQPVCCSNNNVNGVVNVVCSPIDVNA